MAHDYFLTLDNAVKVVYNRLHLVAREDKELLENELFQACLMSDDQYELGYHQALEDMMTYIQDAMEPN